MFILEKKTTSIRASKISLIFIGLMFFLPFISMHHMRPLTVFYSEWIAALFGVIALAVRLLPNIWRTLSNTPISNPLRIPKVSLIFIGLIGILCTQWALGMLHSNKFALLALSYLIWAFLMVVLGGYLRSELGLEKLVATLAFCLVGAGAINILIVVLQFVVRTGGVVPFLPNLSSFGALAQSNHFANFTSLAIASLIYLQAKGHFSRGFFYLLLVLFMFLLSFSGSRSAWLYLISITIFTSILHTTFIKQEKNASFVYIAEKAALWLLPTFILVQLFIYFVIPNEYVDLPTERLLDGVTALSPSIRLQFWCDSLHIYLQSPWLGVGVGKFMANTFLLVDTPITMASKRVFEHAHNLFLHLLAEMGVGAVLIVLAGLFAWAKAFKWRTLNLETWWVICLLTIISIHSMLEYPLWFTFFLGVFAILLGSGDENTISIRLNAISKKILYAYLILLFMLGFLNLSTLLIANIKLENWVEKLSNENVSNVVELNWVRKYSLLSPYGEFMHVLTMSINSKYINDSFLLSQSVMNFKPIGIVTYQHALLLKLQGKNLDAALQFKRAVIAYPNVLKVVLENASVDYRKIYLNLYEALLASTNKLRKK